MDLIGLHHLTAVTADPRANFSFYAKFLGMRLVKKTINQDDTGAYHLFYADAVGTPGTDLTFFHFPLRPERHGLHSITRTGLRVAGEASLSFWQQRLRDAGHTAGKIVRRDGRLTLDFADPEGQPLSLVEDGGGAFHPFNESAIAPEHQIRGIGPVTMSVAELGLTDIVLSTVLKMRPVRDFSRGDVTVHVYEMGEGGPGCELHVAVEPNLSDVSPGAGGVHHVAFRVANDAFDAWVERLDSMRIRNSGPIDRFYFRSLYFREPNGVLLEIATEGPGFTADEPLESLGQRLSLPPSLEPRRKDIEAKLKPL